ncbi:Rieske 2Fe-2S domain-containing protein [Rhodococcoides yunnanense]|uniref:cholesterol 7-desaturase n=1 Tax=Rhodococcoides yunnanense TaxID=278209 RepID=A0ABU4BL18_9NOCA|nr:Rieske 2Fe-2S domain-containing protein [Rhodococcus yunnanensis]MDV6264921.1 Rieske 2Fe-2S domain-containing protein [Rhodococcus yunnanensis]
MQPTGWFQVAWSADLVVGDVVPLHYFGSDLVAYRGKGGHVHVLDAHCQHLGANLAFGGCVVDDGIQCPFHGWVWDGRGKNVRIPYEAKPNRVRKVRSWPVAEINESIYVWHDAVRRDPLWELPDALKDLGSHIAKTDFLPLGSSARSITAKVHVHPQTVAENAVDPHHFKFVHHTPLSPVVLRESSDDFAWQAKVGFGRRWQDAIDDPEDTINSMEIMWSGVGVSFTGEHMKNGTRVTGICPTPVDDHVTDIFASYWIDAASEDPEKFIEISKSALVDDVNIWNHQRYMDPPGLSPSEAAGFRKLRTWAGSFYPPIREPDSTTQGVSAR